MDYEQAIESGAMALFGEKYDKRVRVLSFGDFSTELCGGTHVARAGDIGLFHIISESGVAAGVRRIEALTGQAALDYVRRIDGMLGDVAHLVHGSRNEAVEKVREALERIRALEKENRALKDKLALSSGRDLADAAVDVDGVKVLATRVDGADGGALRAALDQLKSRLVSAIIVLGSVESDSKVLTGGWRDAGSDCACARGGTNRCSRGPSRRQGRRTPGLRTGRWQQTAASRSSARERCSMGPCASVRTDTLTKFNFRLA
jgi:alanyl-tRNA synthetase